MKTFIIQASRKVIKGGKKNIFLAISGPLGLPVEYIVATSIPSVERTTNVPG